MKGKGSDVLNMEINKRNNAMIHWVDILKAEQSDALSTLSLEETT